MAEPGAGGLQADRVRTRCQPGHKFFEVERNVDVLAACRKEGHADGAATNTVNDEPKLQAGWAAAEGPRRNRTQANRVSVSCVGHCQPGNCLPGRRDVDAVGITSAGNTSTPDPTPGIALNS